MRLEKYSFIQRILSLISIKGGPVVLVIFLFSAVAQAQDQTNFTQFYINPYLINPSYAGIDGQPALSIIYRKQWMTIDGGPTIANFSLQGPISPRASWGLSITNDSKGLLNNSSLLLTFGYNVPLSEHSFVRFGISGGAATRFLESLRRDASPTAYLFKCLHCDEPQVHVDHT